MPEPLLRLEKVTVAFGAVEVLSGIDLEVRDVEYLALAGPSGIGKTSMLNVCS
jgi:ABC-type branched-subunit amino acid transport system ATPase component